MTPSFYLNLCRLFLPNHGLLVVKVLIFLSTANFCAAQPRTSASSAPPFIDPLPPPAEFNPSLALLMVIIVSAFFCLGFFSIYVRRCTDGRYTRGNFDPTGPPIGGGGRFSRRGQHGLDSAVVETFPTFLYSTVKGHKIGKGSLECAVCLNEFEDDQTLRLIPKCSHVFHTDCIDVWLVSHPTCPVCRANLLPKPGDLPFDSVNLFELENNSIESDQQPFNIRNETQNDFRIRISDDDDRNRPILQTPNRPPRSWSTGWRLGSFFPKSRSTGHLLVQPREDMERFTLRLPEEIRNQLLNTHLNRAKSCVAFPRATSSRRGYRSRSGGSWRGKNYFYYERFDQNLQPDRMGCSKAPPFMLRTGSVQSSKGIGGSDEMNATPPKSLLKSIKSPFDRLFIGTDNNSNNNNVGEGSSDRLRPDDVIHNQV